MISYAQRKKHIWVFAVVIIILAAALPAQPARGMTVSEQSQMSILQVYITDEKMTIITNGEMVGEQLKCAVSNQSADITEAGLLSDENARISTTILLDISGSMPSGVRNNVLETINKLIESKPANEEYRLMTFGGETTILCDFTSDRYDLATAVEGIKFNGQESNIYDAIHGSIPSISQPVENPTFYRTIVITDGIDDTASGITREELFIRLQNESYPVDVVAVSSRAVSEDKDLAAIVRISSGRYFSLYPGVDTAELSQSFSVGGYYYIEAIVPRILLDGTVRQLDVSDGVINASIDIKFPVYSVEDEEPTSMMDDETISDETPEVMLPVTPIIPEPVESTQSEDSLPSSSNRLMVYIIACALGAVILSAVIVIVLRRKRKKDQQRLNPGIVTGKDLPRGGKETDHTEIITGSDSMGAQYTIKLSNPSNPSKTWILPVSGEVTIGRGEHCTVQFNDRSVSREQCKIVHQGSSLVVIELSDSNKTHLNGNVVTGTLPLKPGDTLKFGRETLQVDYIEMQGSGNSNQGRSKGPYDGMTEALFLGR